MRDSGYEFAFKWFVIIRSALIQENVLQSRITELSVTIILLIIINIRKLMGYR